MRSSVLDALESLSDPDHQERYWLHPREGDRVQDSLDLNIHILFDDTEVLPTPEPSVGSVLFPEDVAPLIRLASVLGPLIDALGDVSDGAYLADTRWCDVVEAASYALRDLRRRGHR